jgi:hypothetical protein
MPRTSPFHSAKPNTRNVYHDNSACTEGNNIERQYLRAGTANRPKCEHCARLDAQGR